MSNVASTALQRQACDAEASVWVAASAGTGKTKVLTDRVLALMLSGSLPERILCLTFTKAAAAEMANRLHRRLSAWATLEEDPLAQELSELLGRAPSEEMCNAARRLFARVLDTPGGLKIATIHAFCQSLLRRFPIEAGLAPHFELIDERGATELLAAVREEVLAEARRGGNPALTAAVTRIARKLRETGFDELIDRIAGERGRFRRLAGERGGIEGVLGRLAKCLDLPRGLTEAQAVANACAEGAFDRAGLETAAAALLESKKTTDQNRGAKLAAWLALEEHGIETFEAYLGVYFTGKGEPRRHQATKAVADARPAVLAALETEARRLDGARRLCAAAALFETSEAALRLALAMLEAYEHHKERRAALDYDDLIARTNALLQREGVAPWVLYKLDGGLDHLLIDEAQDTNPEQWQVVQALTGEFFAGAGARSATRTVFAVGDAKQSIFSFQGADPGAFPRMRAHFAERARMAVARWHPIMLETSYRSTEPVLAAIDAIFARDQARDGVALKDETIRHRANRQGLAGRVELWPLVVAAERPASDDWAPPVDPQSAVEPEALLARAIAATIAGWLASKEQLLARGRPIRPGDIMVLVRKRGPFVGALVRALKDIGVAVAGVDRMRLAEQLAVEDLLALGDFLLLPEDDLTLATLLKSPLLGLEEEQLFALAHGRGKRSLWSALRRRASEAPAFADAARLLSSLLARADFAPPYELFAEVLGPLGGRRKILQRLGPDAAEPLDELLAAALAHERDHGPSLQGFLHWLRVGEAEIKRDLDQGQRDEVRVLTVHGAKGLEAPIVFLPDTTQVPDRVEPLLWTEEGLPLWPVRTDDLATTAADARAAALRRQAEEHRRLLYVALTRAADRLYVCGWEPGRELPEDCWYALAREGLAAAPGVRGVAMDFAPLLAGSRGVDWKGQGLVLESAQTAPAHDDRAEAMPAASATTLPIWARRPPRAEPTPPKPLVPSRPRGPEPPVRSPLGQDRRETFRRGRLVHRLLQSLPDLPPRERRAAAERFLALPVHALAAEERAEIAEETLAVLAHPEFAPLFAPGSKAEVPVVGLIGNRALAGQIDRLVVTEKDVLIVDYKTLRPAPASEGEVPALYLDQLAAYSTAIAAIYPGRAVRAALLWTEGPRLMPISPALLTGRAP